MSDDLCACGNRFDGDNLCMLSACQWEGMQARLPSVTPDLRALSAAATPGPWYVSESGAADGYRAVKSEAAYADGFITDDGVPITDAAYVVALGNAYRAGEVTDVSAYLASAHGDEAWTDLMRRYERTLAENVRLLGRLARVEALHIQGESGGFCNECGLSWPCTTRDEVAGDDQ